MFLNAYIFHFLGLLGGIWFLHILVYLVIPFTSQVETRYALLYSLCYVALCISAAFITRGLVMSSYRKGDLNAETTLIDLISSPHLLPTLTILSLIGVGLHLYDKIVINQFDYSGCLAAVRDTWIQRGIGRGYSISSWQSALGHILSHFSFMTIAVLILVQDRVNAMARRFYSSAAIVGVLIYASVISSRSTLLFLLYTCILAGVLRNALFPGRLKMVLRGSVGVFLGVTAALVFFAVYVFWDGVNCEYGEPIRRGLMSRTAATQEYSEGYLDDLAIKVKLSDIGIGYGGGVISEIQQWTLSSCPMCNLVGIYLSHGLWNFDSALAAEEHSGTAFWGFAGYWGRRIGVGKWDTTSGSRAYPRGAISLPGAAWYDFGMLGMLLIAVLHGTSIALVGAGIQQRGLLGAISIPAYFCLGLVSLWSPLAFAANVMSFPFVGWGFLITFLVLGLRRRHVREQTRKPRVSG